MCIFPNTPLSLETGRDMYRWAAWGREEEEEEEEEEEKGEHHRSQAVKKSMRKHRSYFWIHSLFRCLKGLWNKDWDTEVNTWSHIYINTVAEKVSVCVTHKRMLLCRFVPSLYFGCIFRLPVCWKCLPWTVQVKLPELLGKFHRLCYNPLQLIIIAHLRDKHMLHEI